MKSALLFLTLVAAVSSHDYHPSLLAINPFIRHPPYYADGYDFTDYSQHFTRTDPASRNSGAQPPPSGPYFAHELKSLYHNPVQQQLFDKVYQTSWNSLDAMGNDFSPHQKPAGRPPPGDFVHNWETPIRKPVRRKKQKHRPAGGYHKFPQHRPGVNQLEKVSDIGAQSIVSTYPNSVMGPLSLAAGLVWYLVNKSATPVVKMRSGTSAEEDDTRPLLEQWWAKPDCQLRTVCESVADSPALSSVARWTQSIYRSGKMQQWIPSLKNETSEEGSRMTQLLRAVWRGERGVDCSAFYQRCDALIPEARDRRR